MSHTYNAIKEYASLRVGSSKREVVTVGNSLTLTSSQSGTLILLSSTNGSSITLPSVAGNAGLTFELVVSATSAGHIITGASATLIGSVPVALSTTGVVIASTGGTTLSTTVGSAVGDKFSLVCTGSKWLVSGAASNFNGAIFA